MSFHLAQLNVGIARLPMDHPDQAEFVEALDRINAMADASPGFVWRLTGGEDNALDLRLPDVTLDADTDADRETLVNMSVWTDIKSLHRYVYRSAHVDYLKRRDEWFVPQKRDIMVLWWIPEGHIPTLTEAAEKLALLHKQGPTRQAFTFSRSFQPYALEPGEGGSTS